MAEPKPNKRSRDTPYCKLCKEEFPTFSALHEHGKSSPVHRTRFGCDICNKGFLRRSFQRAHQLKRHPVAGAPDEVPPKERGHPCRLCDVVVPYRKKTLKKKRKIGGRYHSELAKHLNSHGHGTKESAMKEQYYQDKGWDKQSGMHCSCKKHFMSQDTFNTHMLLNHAPGNELDSDQSAGVGKEIETGSAEDEHEDENEDGPVELSYHVTPHW